MRRTRPPAPSLRFASAPLYLEESFSFRVVTFEAAMALT